MFHLSVCLSVCPPVRPSACISVRLSVRPFAGHTLPAMYHEVNHCCSEHNFRALTIIMFCSGSQHTLNTVRDMEGDLDF